MWKNDEYVSNTDITDKPELAYYSKDGKVLCALEDAKTSYEKHLFQKFKDANLVQEFNKLNAILASDLNYSIKSLYEIAEKASKTSNDKMFET